MEAEEDKMVEHAKKAIETLTDKKKNRKEKIGDFLLEILIIIIAVNITIWFHNWSEQRHERALEKEFLIGTWEDLSINRQNLDVSGFQATIDYYDSVWAHIKDHRIDKAYVDTNSFALVNTSYFIYDNSRFENFKSSGYLRLIENETLAKNITRLYANDLPWRVEMDNTFFNEIRQNFTTYIGSKVRIDSSGFMYVSELLNDPGVQFHIYFYGMVLKQRQNQMHNLSLRAGEVMDEIDKELKERFGYDISPKK